MNVTLEHLRTVVNCMKQLDTRWALIGGLAVSVHGTPRTTRDIDLAIVLDTESDQKNLIDQLLKLGFNNKQILMQTEPTQKLGIRLTIPTLTKESAPLDLLYSSSGIEKEVVESAENIEIFPQIFIPIATRAHLLAMKILSENEADRIQDILDIKSLLSEATESDIKTAKEALALIEKRGFSRGKNLDQRFDQLRLKLSN